MFGTFRGGVHPNDAKTDTRDKPTEMLPPPEQVIIPLSQHIGAPARAVVAKGDAVKKGQIIGEQAGFISAPVHATVAGTVKAVEPRPHYMGRAVPAVVIDNDGSEEWAPGVNVECDWTQLSVDDLKERVQNAGIVGLGGATFPAYVKLSPPPDQPIDTVILNGAECEPYVTCDFRMMLERPAEIVEGLKVMIKVLGAEQAFIGIEDNKPEAVDALTKAAAGEANIAVTVLHVKYPQGSEKQLIYACTGRVVPAGALPMAVGVVNHNVGTTIAVYEAVKFNRPLIERALTISGEGVENAGNYMVRIGTPLGVLLDKAVVRESANKLILGGPMMGLAQGTQEIPVVKGTNNVLVLAGAGTWEARPCIRCGRCVGVCPMFLLPSHLSRICEAQDMDEMKKSTILDCFECGCCTYVCPSKRPIVQHVKWGKAELQKLKAAEAKKAKESA